MKFPEIKGIDVRRNPIIVLATMKKFFMLPYTLFVYLSVQKVDQA